MISLVVPCYNEFEVLDELYRRLTAAAESWSEPFEVILVDDGSDDRTWRKVEAIHRRDPRWKVVRFARNFGHQTAVSAGIHHTSGEAVIILDADLQDPPEQLDRFIAKWREGYDVVYAVRRKRKENVLKRSCYGLFYRLLAKMSDTPIPVDSGDFCLIDRRVADLLIAMPEQNRFLRGLRAWVGFRQVGIEYERHARAAGKPKYTFAKLVQLALDGFLSFSSSPLRLAGRLGLLLWGTAVAVGAFALGRWMTAGAANQNGTLGPGTLLLVLAGMAFLAGMQLVCLGIMSEYVGRIYAEVRGRPLWVVRETRGLEDRNETEHPHMLPYNAGHHFRAPRRDSTREAA